MKIDFDFKIPPNNIINGYNASIRAFVKLSPSIVTEDKELIDSGNGYMVLPAKKPKITVFFPRQFKRYYKGVYYNEKYLTVGISPIPLPDNKHTQYTIEFEVAID